MKELTTRTIMAYFWSVTSAIFIGYILVMWGSEKEILTLIIGLIQGTIIGGIFGVYFGGANGKHPSGDNSAGDPIKDGDEVTVTKDT